MDFCYGKTEVCVQNHKRNQKTGTTDKTFRGQTFKKNGLVTYLTEPEPLRIEIGE